MCSTRVAATSTIFLNRNFCSSICCSAVVLLLSSILARSSILVRVLLTALTSLANVAHCFSTSCAWQKLFGFSRTTDVDFSAELSQGISWWLRPPLNSASTFIEFANLRVSIFLTAASNSAKLALHLLSCSAAGPDLEAGSLSQSPH